MPPLTVVENLHVLEQGGADHELRGEWLAGEQSTFQRGEESFGHRVVITVVDRPHRAADAHRLAVVAKEQRSVLAAMIRMVNASCAGLAIPDGHLQRTDQPGRPADGRPSPSPPRGG